MRIRTDNTSYTMWLSKADTYDWANKSGAVWPCSTLSNMAVKVDVDCNGLCDMTVNGKYPGDDIDGCELDAMVADHLPTGSRHLWPIWEESK